MRIANDLCIDGGVMTGTSIINGTPVWVGHAVGISLRAEWTGSATGEIKLQASCNPKVQTTDGASPVITDWTDITNSEYTIATAGDYMWNIDYAYYPWIRVVYENATGVGVLDVRFNTKGF